MDEGKKKAPPKKKPYAKPAVKKVELKPDEAILGGCKTTGTSGPSDSNCGIPIPCVISSAS